MQPQNPNQQSADPNPYSFASFTPAPPEGSHRRKKLYLMAGISLGILLLLGLIAAMSGDKKTATSVMERAASNAQTSVEMADYDQQGFSLKYPKGLNVLTSEALEDQPGWFLDFRPSENEASYSVSLLSSNVESEYESGEDAITELADDGVEPHNIQTSDVVVAGVKSKKTTASFTRDGVEYIMVYVYAHTDKQHYLEVTATYDKKLTNITDSFDVMLGSIKIK